MTRPLLGNSRRAVQACSSVRGDTLVAPASSADHTASLPLRQQPNSHHPCSSPPPGNSTPGWLHQPLCGLTPPSLKASGARFCLAVLPGLQVCYLLCHTPTSSPPDLHLLSLLPWAGGWEKVCPCGSGGGPQLSHFCPCDLISSFLPSSLNGTLSSPFTSFLLRIPYWHPSHCCW